MGRPNPSLEAKHAAWKREGEDAVAQADKRKREAIEDRLAQLNKRANPKPRAISRASIHELQFCRMHKTLRVTPAMATGVTDRVWDMNDVAALIAAQEAPVAKRGPYKKKAA
jgi:hypothetical protein